MQPVGAYMENGGYIQVKILTGIVPIIFGRECMHMYMHMYVINFLTSNCPIPLVTPTSAKPLA